MRTQTCRVTKRGAIKMLYDPAFVSLYAENPVSHSRVSYVSRDDLTGAWWIDLRPALPVLGITEADAEPLDRGPYPSREAAIDAEIEFMQSQLCR